MSSSIKDDLASLKIERRAPSYRATPGSPQRAAGGRLLSFMLWLIPLTLLGAGATVAYKQYDKIKPRPEVNVGVVQAMTIGEAETLLSAKGYLKSHNQAMIGSKMPGRVEKMLVEEGSRVEAGDLLAVLEHEDMIAQLESRKAMLARTQAELQEARSDLELKKIQAARRLQLQARGTITGEEVDQYVFDRDMAAARVMAIEAGLRAQQASIRESESLIENMKVYAPFSGTVTEKGAEVGETITPGGMGAASGRGSVVTLADLQNLEVETDISENLLSRVKAADPGTGYEGQPAEITVSAVTDHRYNGRLVRIIPMGDRSRGTVKVDVEILDPDDRLFPELAATVHFLPDKKADNPNAGKTFLFVPKQAIIEEAGHSHVWVIDANSTLRKRQVQVVVSNNDDLARVEKGLEANERVVLEPSKSHKEGDLVTIAE